MLNLASKSSPETYLKEAIRLHQRSDLVGASHYYRETLHLLPDQTLALTNLGAISLANGEFDTCLELLTRSLTINPHQHLAEFNCGNSLNAKNLPQEAIASFLRCITIRPDYYHAYINLGNAYQSVGDIEHSLMSYQAAIELNKENPLAHYNRGIVLKNVNSLQEAIDSFEQAIVYQPDHFEAYKNIADIFQSVGNDDEALFYYQKTIAIKDDYAQAHNNCGLLLHQMGHFESALNYFVKAITLDPKFAAAFNNSALTLRAMRLYDDALNNYDCSIAIDNNPLARFNKSLLQLGMGDYVSGWKAYEYRWSCSTLLNTYRAYNKPRWVGDESPYGKTIFIYSEQGLGDTIQFGRYIPMLESQGAKVIFEAPASLVRLLSSLSPTIRVVDKTANVSESEFDCYSPLMSLPLAFKTEVQSIPNAIPYVSVSSESIEYWRNKIGITSKPKIGIVWSTMSPAELIQARAAVIDKEDRSIPFLQLESLLNMPFEFYSLQKEVSEEDAIHIEKYPNVHHFGSELKDFTDTAALAKNMDLAISIDTSIVHLAGAVGLNIWVLVNYVSDFRWLLDRNDSPWYPTATLFRQDNYRDWTHPIAEVQSKLLELI